MDELRTALLNMFAEQMGMVDELDPEQRAVLKAWNKAFPENTITDEHIEEMMD